MTPLAAVVPSFGEAIPDGNTIAALVARGRKYFAAGDVAAARLVLRPAALAGDSVAALALGESYDPVVLKRLGVIGLSGDPTQARDWYRKAAELGSADAPKRLDQLTNQLNR
jgi:TPR repeat protein